MANKSNTLKSIEQRLGTCTMIGKTPGKLIHEAIVAEPKLLLKDASHNIASVADELHFRDQASFGKLFKKHTGFTP